MMKQSIAAFALLAAASAATVHGAPCEEAAQSLCKESAEEGDLVKLGECLQKKQVAGEISDEKCSGWLKMHTECKDDLDKHCEFMAYGNDAELCLTQWKVKQVSDTCKAALPIEEKKEEEPVQMSKAAKKRKAEHKKIREEATAKIKAEKEGKGKKKSKGKKGKKGKKDEL